MASCTGRQQTDRSGDQTAADSVAIKDTIPAKPAFSINDIKIERELLYDQYTLEDTYPYKDTVRVVQWDKIRERLFFLDSIQQERNYWVTLQNYKNLNGESPTIRDFVRNEYKRVSDQFGVERYQSVAVYLPTDSVTPERYSRDGSLAKLKGEEGSFYRIEPVDFDGEWLVKKKYVKMIGDTVTFEKVIVVDRKDQNIATLEKDSSIWKVRSVNPATTGRHNPPYGQETPLGLFIIQENKPKMIYLKDGSQALGGFAPYASRFSNGGYIHGVPVNAPNTRIIEYSQTLGTIPRSHMCVRNASSHAKFIYEWAPVLQTVMFVIE